MRIISENFHNYDTNWWENLYKKCPHKNNEEELNTFKVAYELIGDNSVIDIGCGEGEASQYFTNYEGIDWSKTVVERAKSRFGDKFSVGCVKDLTKRYDFALVSQVLEHIENPKEFIESIPADRAIIILPNGQIGEDIVHNDKSLLSGITEHTDYHYAVYSLEDIQEMFPDSNAQIIGNNIICNYKINGLFGHDK